MSLNPLAPRGGLGRRHLLAALPGLLAAPAVLAQGAWPNRPVRVVVPWPPGGTADIVARIFFTAVARHAGQAFVIENRSGATGTIGAANVAQAAPDGYTVLHSSTGLSLDSVLFPNLSYLAQRDLVPVFRTIIVPQIVLAHPSLPARNAAELIALAKREPGTIDAASAGNGSVQHLALELFAREAGISVNHIPYRGGAPAYTDLLAGRVKLYFGNANGPGAYLRDGKLHGLAHTGRGRLAAFPDIAPLSDTVPGFETYEWNGVFLPKGTPEPIVGRLNALLNAALADAEVADKLREQELLAEPNTPQDFAAFFQQQSTRWQGFVREANIRLD